MAQSIFAPRKRILSLIRTPIFLIVTLWGNIWIFLGALLFHIFEAPTNPVIHHFLDSLIWAVGMVTTVGGGTIQPITIEGKFLSILMMMGGALFLWSYMAFFVGALVDSELQYIQKEVSELQHDMEKGDHLLTQLKKLTHELEAHLEQSKATAKPSLRQPPKNDR